MTLWETQHRTAHKSNRDRPVRPEQAGPTTVIVHNSQPLRFFAVKGMAGEALSEGKRFLGSLRGVLCNCTFFPVWFIYKCRNGMRAFLRDAALIGACLPFRSPAKNCTQRLHAREKRGGRARVYSVPIGWEGRVSVNSS